MADTATNSGLTLHQITDVNTCLASTTTKQYDTITKLLLDIKLQSASPGTGDAAREKTTPDQKIRTIKTLQAAIKNHWAVGGFCSTHGWVVGLHHTSSF